VPNRYNVYRERKDMFYDRNGPADGYVTFRDWLILHDRFSRRVAVERAGA